MCSTIIDAGILLASNIKKVDGGGELVPVYFYYVVIIASAAFFGSYFLQKFQHDSLVKEADEARLRRLKEEREKLTKQEIVKEEGEDTKEKQEPEAAKEEEKQEVKKAVKVEKKHMGLSIHLNKKEVAEEEPQEEVIEGQLVEEGEQEIDTEYIKDIKAHASDKIHETKKEQDEILAKVEVKHESTNEETEDNFVSADATAKEKAKNEEKDEAFEIIEKLKGKIEPESKKENTKTHTKEMKIEEKIIDEVIETKNEIKNKEEVDTMNENKSGHNLFDMLEKLNKSNGEIKQEAADFDQNIDFEEQKVEDIVEKVEETEKELIKEPEEEQVEEENLEYIEDEEVPKNQNNQEEIVQKIKEELEEREEQIKSEEIIKKGILADITKEFEAQKQMVQEVEMETAEKIAENRTNANRDDYRKLVQEKTKSILEQISFEEIDYNLEKDFSGHKIYLFLSPEKTGKTTIAVNLAEELSGRGIKTTLIDTDTRKQDAYYYFNTHEKGCLSKLSGVKSLGEIYELGLPVNPNLKLFSEHKGVAVNIEQDDIIKLVKISAKHSEVVLVDCANYMDPNTINKLIELAYEVFVVASKQVNVVCRLPERLFEQRKMLQTKKVNLIINMDQEIDYLKKSVIINYFKNVSVKSHSAEKYTIPINQTFSVAYDLKSIIIGLTATRQPAIKVKNNKILSGIKQIADYIVK